jgi:hypothetical protein
MGIASEKLTMVSFDHAVAEIAKVHFDGDLIEAEADLLLPLRESAILAYKNLDAISESSWLRQNPWSSTLYGSPGLSRRNTRFFRSHLQELYDNTLWKEKNSKEKSYRGKLYRDGVYFTKKIDKNGLDGRAKWNALKEGTQKKWNTALTIAIKYAPDHPNNKSALASKVLAISGTKNSDRRLGDYFENWNSPES